MVERQEADPFCTSGAFLEIGVKCCEVVVLDTVADVVAVSDHYTFWDAGCAGGVVQGKDCFCGFVGA